jgi:hypothetical protein
MEILEETPLKSGMRHGWPLSCIYSI